MKLAALLKQHNVRIERLAADTGSSASNIRSIVAGDSKPGVDLAIAIARFFNVPVESIEWGAKPSPDDDAGKGVRTDAA